MKFFLLIFFSFIQLNTFSYERADGFIVKVYDEKVQVLSPTKFDSSLAVVIENKTLAQIRGKLETGSGEVLNFISIEPGKFTSVSVKKLKEDRLFFVPLSPPLQKVELIIGNKPYEIPPKQESE